MSKSLLGSLLGVVCLAFAVESYTSGDYVAGSVLLVIALGVGSTLVTKGRSGSRH